MYKKESSLLYQTFFMFKNFLIFDIFYKNRTAFNNTKIKFFDYSNIFKITILIVFWTKLRVVYYVNNWIYTTNHKRIAVNYFWFVILSGIVGMVLATLIRLEFAYPGVGIFAGDSIQYLSLATAHGVIMVFFMIMPLLFGAFANFLLPTQLGVHDVAFPRLNSAAFWFLPGGLLMLCQLVCIDRRYQRMNCFNIREIQSILKRKFFTDLINSHEHRTLLDKTAMGLRYKTDNINSINSNMFVFYNYGVEFAPKVRTTLLVNENSPNNNVNSLNSNSIFFNCVSNFKKSPLFFFINTVFILLVARFTNFTANFVFFKNTFLSFIFKCVLLFDSAFNNLYTTAFSLFSTSSTLSTYYFDLNRLIFETSLSGTKIVNYLFTTLTDALTTFYYLQSNILKFNSLLNNPFNGTDFLTLNDGVNLQSYNLIGNLPLKLSIFVLSSYFLIFDKLFTFINNFKLYISTQTTLYKKAQSTDLNYSDKYNILNESGINNTHFNIFKKSFFSELDYNSRVIHFYFLIYFFLSIPYTLISFVKIVIFDKESPLLLNKLYNFFTNWYFTFIMDNNLFELLIDESRFNLSSVLKKLFIFKINYYTAFIKQPVYFNPVLNISQISTTLSELFLNTPLTQLINNLNEVSQILTGILLGARTFNIFMHLISMFNFAKNNNVIFNSSESLNYTSNFFSTTDSLILNKYSDEEVSTDYRYLKFTNPVFKYDYKSGDYFPKLYKEVYTSLFTTLNDLTGGLRTSPWFFSDKFKEIFDASFSTYLNSVLKSENSNNSAVMHATAITKFLPTDAFYNFFFLLSTDDSLINKKSIALGSLNQKFYRMFNTSSMQQRVYSNWRQLKFTREAWRCKLLAARHQKTLFKRYVHEDGVFWSIERNAKDLLPGWAMITPFSARTRFTAVGKTDIGLMGVLLVLNSSIISGANFLVTYRYLSTLNNRKMRDARAFFTEGVMVASWMMLLANPMLVIGIIMLLSDRHWQTSFFDYSGGGDTVLFQHMFWFFGHPEVYVIIIPTFGFTNTMISYYLKKRVSARASLLYSMYTIAFLGFFVWGHHMYMVGLAHTTRMLFSTLTVMISVPAATKIMHWCVTTVNSSFSAELPLLFTFTFIFFFVSGGISGMCVAHTGMDILFHDTFYVIGHFHVMLAGAAMFGSFGAFYFYFPAIFGVKFSRIYAYLHYSYYLLGQLMTVIPMFWLGYAGMPRRVLDYPASLGGWHSIISAGHMLSVAGLMAFFIMIFDSLRQGRAVIRNNFGISRYNTRLNFYLYEIARLTYVQQKGLNLFRTIRQTSIKLDKFNYFNFEPYETTLLTYTFAKK